MGGERVEHDIYRGYKLLSGTTKDINEYMELINTSIWHVNEYLIIQNTDDDSEKEMRWDGNKFVPLKLPQSKFIKGKNALQRCALDLLNNKDITICAILGPPGSGKSYLTTRMADYCVREKGWQSKICFVREPWGQGRTEGYLKGTFEEKNSVWVLPIKQQFDGQEYEVDRMQDQGIIEFNIPTYMKGTTYPSTVLMIDEAEDLSEKQIRLIGTRIGEEGRIFWNGDYRQSLLDDSFNNPLLKMCNLLKGNKLFGCILLDEDVRSETSKLYAEMFQ